MSIPPTSGASGKWRSLPLRVRLAALTTALLVAGLGIAGAATVTLLRGYLVQAVDERLVASAAELARSTPSARDRDASQLPSDFYLLYTPTEGEARERIQARLLELAGRPNVPELTTAQLLARQGEPFTTRGQGPLGSWRVVMYPVRSVQGLAGSVAIALPLRDVEATLTQIRRVLMVSGLAIVLLGGLAGSMAVRRALQPLRDVEATAHAFAAGDLARRVPAEPPTTEVGSLALSLNGMLAQIERAFAAQAASEERMRRFVADASHELRTPLSTVRGYGELYRMGAIAGDEIAPAMRRIEDEAIRMGALVNDLLQLAKLDEGRPLNRTPVDLRVLAGDAVADLRALDPGRPVRLVDLTAGAASGTVADVLVLGDEGRLRQVVSNLIGNVARHTPPGTPAEIALGREPAPGPGYPRAPGSSSPGELASRGRPGDVVLEVRDHGPGIPEQDAERVFERFFRIDSSRARTSGGTGLGLAIVAAIVAAHGGSVRVRPTPGGGTTIRLTLPPIAVDDGDPA